MQIEIQGEGVFEVPDDATPEEIAALTAPRAPPPNPGQDVTDELGPVEGALTAFGEGARHLIRQGGNYLAKIPGVRQAGEALGMPPDPTDAEVEEASRNLGPLRRRFPVASALGVASLAVPAAVGAATAALPASLTLPQLAVGSALLGGAQGEMFSDPSQRIAGRNAGIKYGAALPLAIGAGANVAGRFLARSTPKAAPLPDDEYLYHVTPEENAGAIRSQGLRADAPKLSEDGMYGDTRAVFLADAETYPTYQSLYGDEGLAVFRVPKQAVGGLSDDIASEGVAYLTRDSVPARNLEQLVNGKWVPVTSGGGTSVPGALIPTKSATPAARELMREGVPLTPGQQNPAGTWNQIEEATTSVPGVGPAVARMRGAAAEKDIQRIFAKATPPGEAAPPAGDPAEMLTHLKAGFDRAYAGVKGEITRWGPAELPNRFAAVTANPEVVADDAVRASVGRFLQNQATAMSAEAPTVEKLLKVRSAIRSAAANAEGPALQLLRAGEAQVTEALAQGAPPQALARLKAIDRQYAQYKTLEDATRAAGDRAMTHTDLSRAVARATPGAAYARGGGLLRREAQVGKETFGSVSPATGQRLLTLSAGTPGVRHALGAASYLRANAATSPAAGMAPRFAGGVSTEAEQLAARLGIPAERAESLIARLIGALRMAPAPADEADRSRERIGTNP